MTTIRAIHPSRCLVDTNILLRLAQPEAEYPYHHRAIASLAKSGTRLFIAVQNVAEFWNVSTRPLTLNGRALSLTETQSKVIKLETQFELLTEDRETYDRWRRLLVDYSVSGRQVHDARLVAHMLVRAIPAILTSNTKDFARYPHVQLLDPERMPL